MLKENLFIEFQCHLDNGDFPEPMFEVISLTVTEEISRPYEIIVQLTSPRNDFFLDDFIRKPANVRLDFGNSFRDFNGLIGEMSQKSMVFSPEGEARYHYQAKIYPNLWFLQFDNHFRIFQEMPTLEIVRTLFYENGIEHFSFPKFYDEPVKEFCVQYNESIFNFINRLLEDRGVYYYFHHNPTNHSLHLGNAPHDQLQTDFAADIIIQDIYSKKSSLNAINTYEIYSSMIPKTISIMDYDYNKASQELMSSVQGDAKGGTFYEYPGNYTYLEQGEIDTRMRMDIKESGLQNLRGKSYVPFFCPGHMFPLMNHPHPSFDNTIFTIKKVEHFIKNGRFCAPEEDLYYNNFDSFPTKAPYRPEIKTPKPKIYGSQTALVVGPPGEEVWTDELGRVKVQFRWNHRGYLGPMIMQNVAASNEAFDTQSNVNQPEQPGQNTPNSYQPEGSLPMQEGQEEDNNEEEGA